MEIFFKKKHFKNMSKNQNFMDYLFYYVVCVKKRKTFSKCLKESQHPITHGGSGAKQNKMNILHSKIIAVI